MPVSEVSEALPWDFDFGCWVVSTFSSESLFLPHLQSSLSLVFLFA